MEETAATPKASLLRRGWPLLVTLLTTALFFAFGERMLTNLDQPAWFAFN